MLHPSILFYLVLCERVKNVDENKTAYRLLDKFGVWKMYQTYKIYRILPWNGQQKFFTNILVQYPRGDQTKILQLWLEPKNVLPYSKIINSTMNSNL